MNNDTVGFILEYIWVPVVGTIAMMWRRVNGLDTRTQLIQQHDKIELVRREEDRAQHTRDRREALDKIDSHHKTVMDKLEKLELRIKNGH